jgi:YggT family protein
MAPLIEALIFIIQTLFHFYLLLVLLRFILQVARADFYNPISQFIVKATNPPLKPLRRIIPGLAGVDLASLLLALIIQLLAIWSVAALYGLGFINPLTVIIWAFAGTSSFIVNIFFFGLIISVISSWIAPGSRHPALMLVQQMLEPLMAPIRRLIPPMGGIDISPIFAFLLLQVLKIFISYVPVQPQLVLGI